MVNSLDSILIETDRVREKIRAYGQLSPEILRRIEYQFRLECNYFSNRQEGGTLTRRETRSVMIDNITVDGKPLREIREMRGHDEAMLEILRTGRGEVRLSERRIRDFHRLIVVFPETEKVETPGAWKRQANEIINDRGEKFSFTPPDEVPEAMHQLLNWLGAQQEKISSRHRQALHPLVVAFDFHHRLLTIHPFSDGNGRVARLLSNLLLVAYEYPPFFINDEEKDTYNRYLADIQGYGGDPNLLIAFMCKSVIRSQHLVLDIIEGNGKEEK